MSPTEGKEYKNSYKFPKINGSRRTSIEKLWPGTLVVDNPVWTRFSLEDQRTQANENNRATDDNTAQSTPTVAPKLDEILQKLQKLTQGYLHHTNSTTRPIVEILSKILNNEKKTAQERIVNFYEQLNAVENDSQTNLQHIKEDKSYSAKQFLFGIMVITATLATGIIPGLVVIGIVKALTGKSPIGFFKPSTPGEDYLSEVNELSVKISR